MEVEVIVQDVGVRFNVNVWNELVVKYGSQFEVIVDKGSVGIKVNSGMGIYLLMLFLWFAGLSL